ncbi:4'-phosphopantetheinyl transferase family protein [Spirosoma sordidisoli]|uniref:4'-phosphopantetheinyl transferase superfamily protein n=1 Tax=Spirosoma sordidisoli TaxID=2502893 RepID=A0A4V1RVZ2_9BACT|nr:4'-phosphopantetheinyl transferase superfamily protein [Spirosoma sordidisoli]RYC68458.1 4'-phosphopantetheinyl transferase superfamily protein [Spirosoma sordidisoli]
MLHVYWTRLEETDTLAAHEPSLRTFPAWLQQKVHRHRTARAALASFWGYRLLQLATAHWPQPVWQALTTDYWGRPLLNYSAYDFNLSHSDNCVVCALHQNGRVGVDTQGQAHPTRLKPAYQTLFQPHEWTRLCQDPTSFTDLWAQKEAVAKADGRGMAAYPHIWLRGAMASVLDTGTRWVLTPLALDSAYRTYVATPDTGTGFLHHVQHKDGSFRMDTTLF